jgi:hypothetical protein
MEKTSYRHRESISIYTSDTVLHQTAYSNLNSKKQPNKTWAGYLNRHRHRKHIHMANKHTRHPVSLLIRKMQLKSVEGYYFTPVRMAKIKRVTKPNVGKNIKQLELFYTAGMNGKWYNYPENN